MSATNQREQRYRGQGPWPAVTIVVVTIMIIVGALVVLVHTSASTSPNTPVSVVAAENTWGNIAAQIGGSRVRVTSIITNPAADPHLYETSPDNAAAVAAANVVVENGLGYDDFMDKLVGASTASGRRVVNAAEVLGITNAGANPHLWYDVSDVRQVAAAIKSALSAEDPSHNSSYAANLQAFDSSLQPIVQTEASLRQRYAGTQVAYTERVPEAMLEACGLVVATPAGFAESIENGNDPSPRDTTAMNQLITDRRIKVLLYNSQTVNATTERVRVLAQQYGIPVVAVSETMPASEHTYQSWQLNQLRNLQTALEAR